MRVILLTMIDLIDKFGNQTNKQTNSKVKLLRGNESDIFPLPKNKNVSLQL